MADPRPRRSVLFLPADNPRALAKARGLPCDTVVLDLEDAVAPEAKDAARAAAVAAVTGGGWGLRELVVRINGFDTPHGLADARALAAARPDAILLPKVSAPATLIAARAAVGPDVPLWAMIETARGMLDLGLIAAAAPAHGVTALVAGTNDLARELRCRPGADRAPLAPLLIALVVAARAHGLAVLDGVCNRLDAPEQLAAECAQALAWGFDGKTLIHPDQIAAANAAFTPTEAEVADARQLVAAFADSDRGAIRLDGRMVERLHLDAAHRTLALAAAAQGPRP